MASNKEKKTTDSSSTKSTTSSTTTSANTTSSTSNRYNTTVTKKDGTTAKGYIENGKSYYSDGTRISAGDSVVDSTGKVWTMKDDSSGSSGTGSSPYSNAGIANYAAGQGVNIPTSSTGGRATGSYKSTGIEKPERTSYLRSTKELAELYDINYDMTAIKNIYDKATDLKYALLSKELEQGENDFYTNNANANATLLDTLKKATSSAIATGASRGIAGAEQLGLMMDAQQNMTEEATNIAQERANMADEMAVERAENIINALEYSNQVKQALAGVSSNVYSADTQYDVGLLDWAAQMKNVEALFEQIAAEERTNDKNRLSNETLALLEDARIRSEGDKDRDTQKYGYDKNLEGTKYNADKNLEGTKYNANSNAAASKYAADKNFEAYTSSGGNKQLTWLDDVKDAQETLSTAYANGDIELYIAARRQLTGESAEEIRKVVNSDPNFKNSAAWQKSNNKTVSKTQAGMMLPLLPILATNSDMRKG